MLRRIDLRTESTAISAQQPNIPLPHSIDFSAPASAKLLIRHLFEWVRCFMRKVVASTATQHNVAFSGREVWTVLLDAAHCHDDRVFAGLYRFAHIRPGEMFKDYRVNGLSQLYLLGN